MDILIYAKPEKVEHKMVDKVDKEVIYCYWNTSKLPSINNRFEIDTVYFSNGNKIFAEGDFTEEFMELEQALTFLPLKRVNKKQPKNHPQEDGVI